MLICLLLLALAVGGAFLVEGVRRKRRGDPFDLPSLLGEDGSAPEPEAERAALAAERGGFDVVLRGYRMDQVDARIQVLEEQVRSLKSQI